MNNANTEELGRIVANAVSNFLSRPDQNNDNSARLTATQTRTTQPQVSIMGCLRNKDIFCLTLLFSLFIFINLAVSLITSFIFSTRSPRQTQEVRRMCRERGRES